MHAQNTTHCVSGVNVTHFSNMQDAAMRTRLLIGGSLLGALMLSSVYMSQSGQRAAASKLLGQLVSLPQNVSSAEQSQSGILILPFESNRYDVNTDQPFDLYGLKLKDNTTSNFWTFSYDKRKFAISVAAQQRVKMLSRVDTLKKFFPGPTKNTYLTWTDTPLIFQTGKGLEDVYKCGNGDVEGEQVYAHLKWLGTTVNHPAEDCDDGNTKDGDTCPYNCKWKPAPPGFCGNSIVEDDEACDNVQGCSNACQNSIGYSCNAAENTCTLLIPTMRACGNNVCEEGESHDPGGCPAGAPPECLGPPARQGTCPQDCTNQLDGTSCSDSDGGNVPAQFGILTLITPNNGQEFSDPIAQPDTCENQGTVLLEYYCEDQQMRSAQYDCPCEKGACTLVQWENGGGDILPMQVPLCGDGIIAADETCDDDNTVDGDYCNADCSTVTGKCGDRVIQENEVCDLNLVAANHQCVNNCTEEIVPDCTDYPPHEMVEFDDGSKMRFGRQGEFIGKECTNWQPIAERTQPGGEWERFPASRPQVYTLGGTDNGTWMILPNNIDHTFVLLFTLSQADRVITGDGEQRNLCGGRDVYGCGRVYAVVGNDKGGFGKPLRIYDDYLEFDGIEHGENGARTALFHASAKTREYAPTPTQETNRTFKIQYANGRWQIGSAGGTCGDGIVDNNEKCDDANGMLWDGCAQCAIAQCEDPSCGYIGDYMKCTGQPSVCYPRCGDGVRDTGEACDDFNRISGDGCSVICEEE